MSKPQDFFRYGPGGLQADGVSLEKVADQVGTPCYVYSAEALLKPLAALKKGLKGLDSLICFSVKSNSNIAILKLLGSQGAGLDLVSGGELYRAAAAEAPAQGLVFSGVGKTPGEMAMALEYGGEGIFSFNVESVAELATLSQVAENIGRKAKVALRFNPDVDAKTHPYISTGLKRDKFGLNKAEILKIARAIDTFPGVEFQGLSIHIGSQILTLSPLNDAYGRTRSLIDTLNRVLPKPLTFVDLGGGLGITYKQEKSPTIAQYCALVHKHFGKRAKLAHPLKVLIEPGRSIAGNAGILLTEVLYRKVRSAKDFLIVDAAMNDLLRPSLYGSYHEVVPVKKPGKSRTKKTDIVGPVCESGDCLASDRPVSTLVNQGDLMAILSAGAYGFSMSGNYNSRPRPAEVLLKGGKMSVIRDRENYDDLIRGENF